MPDVFFCEIIENTELTDAVYSITFESRVLAREAVAGQFLHVKCGEARLLRRPISICYVKDNKINFVFEVKGEGTRWLSKCRPGQILNILGPLGKGFKLLEGNLIVVGGGVGTPPMLFAAEQHNKAARNKVTAILGFRSADRIILVNEFNSVCEEVIVTTDDGSAGIHGAVTKPLEELLKSNEYATVISCGQHLMQKAVAEVSKQYGVPCQVSLEERMGCGVGACLVCACAIKSNDDIKMQRACIDGPVFNSNDVIW